MARRMTLLSWLSNPPTQPVQAGPPAAQLPPWTSMLPAAGLHRTAALRIPAVRRARSIICGTIAGWDWLIHDRSGATIDHAADPATRWLTDPDPSHLVTRQSLLTETLDDLIWHDRSCWQILDWSLAGHPAAARRLDLGRWEIQRSPYDPPALIVDGRPADPRRFIYFDGGGIGGLSTHGQALAVAAALLDAAERYASIPAPSQILKSTGAALTEAEIEKLLSKWEEGRRRRSVAFTSDLEVETPDGWSPTELQLVDAREEAATEIARAFGLPAAALDADRGPSMTYQSRLDAREEILQALRPWAAAITGPINLALAGDPRGLRVDWDVEPYTRANPADRFSGWETAIRSGVLTIDEARAREPYAHTT